MVAHNSVIRLAKLGNEWNRDYGQLFLCMMYAFRLEATAIEAETKEKELKPPDHGTDLLDQPSLAGRTLSCVR